MVRLPGNDATETRRPPPFPDEVVEIGLFLPANEAEALLTLSRQRHQSVGQLLRGLIGQALSSHERN